jgi:hypothetical protein
MKMDIKIASELIAHISNDANGTSNKVCIQNLWAIKVWSNQEKWGAMWHHQRVTHGMGCRQDQMVQLTV